MTLNAYSKTTIIYCRNLDFPSKNAGQPSSRIQQGRPRSVRPGRLLREAGHSPEPGQGLPAPCLARQETVLQPHRLRPSLVQVRILIILRLPLLILHLKGLLALEPQVLSPQELWAHSFYPDVCWLLCPLLHHELRRHL